MIFRTFTICSILVISVLLIFCWISTPVVSPPEDAEAATKHAPAAGLAAKEAGEAAAPFDPASAPRPRFKRKFRDLPEMNIPPGFFMVITPVMLFLLIYVVGIIIHEIDLEDEEVIEELLGKLG